ncbi:MAG: delta-aminolevulinic acid dehydratase [Phycisphaerae bacterium]|nr:delta-aminolevulinic acid dehydratase [Phycisphaerae bacterium]
MNVEPYIDRLRAYVEARDFAGFDPYDALNSPLLRAFSFGGKWGRIAWTQLLKRCPVNLRPLLMVPPGHNPKGIGLFLHSYARLARSGPGFRFQVSGSGKEGGFPQSPPQSQLVRLLALLDELRSTGCSGSCWGYNFPWQSRAAYLPRGTPTIVNTAFIGHALLDTWEWLGNARALELARSIPEFMLHDLNRLEEGEAFCFSYTPADRNFVHNANLMGASLLARIAHAHHERPADTEVGPPAGMRGETGSGPSAHRGPRRLSAFALRETALAALRYSMRYQRENGSWPYAETEFQGWIDSFHTGFNLQAIKYFLDLGLAEEYRPAFERGVTFYVENFFLPDGTPKYYHNRTYPIDIHCPAQALAFLSMLSPRYDALCDRVAQWMMSNLYDARRGYFYYQQTPQYTNRIPYMRWAQAWALHGLTAYAGAIAERERKRPEAQG